MRKIELGGGMVAVEGMNGWALNGEKHTFKCGKTIINKIKFILEHITKNHLGKAVNLSTEICSLREGGITLDSKLGKGMCIAGFVDNNKVWTLTNPTLEDVLRLQYLTRVYGVEIKKDRTEKSDLKNQLETISKVNEIVKPNVVEKGKKKIYYLSEARYKLYLGVSETSEETNLKMMLEDVEEMVI